MNSGPGIPRKLWTLLAAMGLTAIVLSGILGAAAGGAVAYLVLRGHPVAALNPAAETTAPLPAGNPAAAGNGSVAEAVSSVAPSVVTVVNYLDPNRGQGEKSSGSGVVISADGHVVTNAHVVEGSQRLEVILAGGKTVAADLVGSDPFADLAVLKIDPGAAPAATFGDSSTLLPGDTVIAIGSPLGDFTNTVTVGVVSATDRSLTTSAGFRMEGLLQTDAAINRGNSGGPLVDADGEVVGINALVVRGSGGTGVVAEGLGFAIPSNSVRLVTDQLIATGRVQRPYLGIQWEWVTPEVAAANGLQADYGAFVTNVSAGSPAEASGLRRGDFILGIDGTRFDEADPFLNLLLRHNPGEVVTLDVQRDGSETRVRVTLGERPSL